MCCRHWFFSVVCLLCLAGVAHAGIVVGPGSSFTWDGVNGPSVPLALAASVPAYPPNLARVIGATAFARDALGGVHAIEDLNNGVYGNSDSWIGLTGQPINLGGSYGSVNTAFAGISMPTLTSISSLAFGRSNVTGQYLDRTAGTYYVQVTTAANPDKNTPDILWTTIGSIAVGGGTYDDAYRHQFNLSSPVNATGLRIVVPGAANTCIDEIEINGGFAGYSKAVVDSGAVGYWRLGDPAGSTTTSPTTTGALNLGSGGAALNGTYSPAKVNRPGVIGPETNTAADFNGSSSLVQGAGLSTAGPGSTNVFANDWTIEAWFVRDAYGSSQGIFSNNVGVNDSPILTFGPGGADDRIGLMATGTTWTGFLSVDLGQGGTLSYFGKPVYVVMTKTGGNTIGSNTINIYANVDGTWLSTTGTTSWNLALGDGYYFGKHYNSGGNFDGAIDEVAIYARALSFSEITQHYFAATPEPSTIVMGLGVLLSGALVLVFRRRAAGKRS